MTPQATSAKLDLLAFARTVLTTEADAVRAVAGRLGASFEAVVRTLAECPGRVAVTGVGKSADVGQKIVGTLNSTGTRSYLLDATRAVHGDLGMIHPHDAVLVLSHSGESEELMRLLGPLKELAGPLLAITARATSRLARVADHAIVYGPVIEACPLSLAPSTSTTVMLALGDAIALTLSELKQFRAEQFAQFHPAGSLGRKLAAVDSAMRRGAELRIAPATTTVRAVFAMARTSGRRTGAVMLTEPDGRLAGLFTDSDLARLFENRADDAFDRPISEVMTRNPLTLTARAKMADALELLRRRKISELPIVDDAGKPVGLLDITDVIGLLEPGDPAEAPPILRLVGPTP